MTVHELADLLDEYATITDRESLYARVLMSFIDEGERLLRAELERQIRSSIRHAKRREVLSDLAKSAPLEDLVRLYTREH
jgi:hypothetical protein